MDFPMFLKNWILKFNPIKYTPFWYWYRLVNHSDWTIKDDQLYQDFWSNINHGYNHMIYVHKFEEVWGKGSYPPETIILSKEDYDSLVERLNQRPKYDQKIYNLMSRPSPWED